ncbi:MAG: YegP family protein [Sphaerochaetaceae bacterium]
MPGKFIISKTPKGFFRFNLQAANYQTVLTSQNYASLRNCKDGIEAIKKNATAAVEDQTLQKVEKKKFPKYEVYLDNASQFRYRLLASNGQNIAMAEEGYATKQGCLNGIDAISRAAVDAEIDESALGK